MIVYVAELKPILASSGVEQVLRFCSHPSASRTDGLDWKPMLSMPLRRNIQLFDGQFQVAMPDFGALEFALSKGDSRLPITSMLWDGRPVKVWRGTAGQTTGQMTLVFTGVSKDVGGSKRTVSVSLRGNDWLLDKPVLTASYAGTGLAEGPNEIKGRLKPMLLGKGFNIEPVYINKALGIFQWHGYGIQAGDVNPDCEYVYDSGSLLGPTAGDYATYAELAAAVVPGGRFVTCRALGMARHGGEILGVLTIDAWGAYPGGLPGNILLYLWNTAGGMAAALFNQASLTWLNGQVPYPQDIYVSEQKTVLGLSQELMLSLGGYVTYLDDGRVTVGLLRRGGAPTVTLNRVNLASLNVRPTSAPAWKRRQGYQRSWRKHSFSEVRTPKEITPRGAYIATTAYAYYDQVTYNNSSWVMTQALPSTGVTPGTNAAVWTLFSAAGADVGEGTTLPSTGNQGQMFRNTNNGSLYWWNAGAWVELADITAANTAGGIADQGSYATDNFYRLGETGAGAPGYGAGYTQGNVEWTTDVLLRTPSGTASGIANQQALATQPSVYFNGPYIREPVTDVPATVLAFRTADGNSAGFANQQALATQPAVYFNGPYIREPVTDISATQTAYRTADGTAGGIAGQRTLATRNNIRLGMIGAGLGDFGSIETESGLEWGNNALLRTPSGVSSGFSGQQRLASMERVRFGTAGGEGAIADEGNAYWVSNAHAITSAGVSSGYSGQKRYGKVSYFRLGETGDGTADFGAGYTESSAEWMSNSNIRTGSGVSSGFSGQRALATRDTIDADTDFGFGTSIRNRLTPYSLDANYLAAGRIAWAGGNTVEALKPGEAGADVTSNRVSSGFTNQRGLSTRRFIRLGEQEANTFDIGGLITENNAEWSSNVLLRTPSGVSSGFSGQRALATRDTIDSDSDFGVGTSLRNRLTPYSGDNNYLAAGRVAWALGNTVEALKPGEAGADQTANRVSSGYSGQQRYGKVSRFRLGEVNDGVGDFGSGLTENSAEWMGNGNIRTASGTASGVANQQRLATMERVRFGSGAGEGAIANETNAYWVNDASAITSAGIASGFVNQRNLATRHYIQTGLSDFSQADRAGLLLDNATEWANNALIRTASGTAGGIVNQRSYATKDYLKLGLTGGGDGDSGAGLTEGGAEWMGNGNIRTGSGTAAAIANQADWATYTGINTSAMAGRVSRQGNDGRVSDPRIYNTQNILGPSSTTGLSPTYSDYGSGITVNLPAHYRYIAGPGGPIGLYYGGGGFSIGYSQYWIAFIDDPDMGGNGAPSIGYTDSPTQLLYPGRYQVASGYTPNSGGGGGTTTGGGGGGGFAESCVSAAAFVAVKRDGLAWIIAAEVQAGDSVWTMLDAETVEWTECTANKVVPQPSVRLTLDSGRVIECSRSTPITQPDMTTILAGEALGALAGQNSGQGVAWGSIELVEDIGVIDVAHISCNDGTYLAAMTPGEGIFTHNAVKP